MAAVTARAVNKYANAGARKATTRVIAAPIADTRISTVRSHNEPNVRTAATTGFIIKLFLTRSRTSTKRLSVTPRHVFDLDQVAEGSGMVRCPAGGSRVREHDHW
jgi:hypothetical protein